MQKGDRKTPSTSESKLLEPLMEIQIWTPAPKELTCDYCPSSLNGTHLTGGSGEVPKRPVGVWKHCPSPSLQGPQSCLGILTAF